MPFISTPSRISHTKTRPSPSISGKASLSPINKNPAPAAHHISPKALHIQNNNKPVIQLGHLQEFFGTTEGETVGETTIRDKTTNSDVTVEIKKVSSSPEEIYKLVKDGEVIAFSEIKIDKQAKPAKLLLELVGSKEPQRYAGLQEVFNQIMSERMTQLEESEKIEFEGVELISSYNSGLIYFNQGFHLKDKTGLDTQSAKKCDSYIADQINKAGSLELSNTESAGCITMYLPKSGRTKWKKEIAKHPIFESNNFNKGKILLTKKDGKTKVEGQITRTQDPSTGMDLYEIKVDDKVLGSIQLNPIRVNDSGQAHDYCGNYDKSSPFSQYGNGYVFGWGAKKPQSKLCIEIHETLSTEFTNLNEALFQIPMEIAQKDNDFKGRVMIEGDWNEHALFYDMGFRTQKYRGITNATKLEKAYTKEIANAKKEGRVANLKQFGSQTMTISKPELAAKVKDSKPILTKIA